jgi:putative peptide zinc metalloprotease protein
MLSDAIEIPNLYQRAQQQWKYFGDRYILGTTAAQSKATDQKEWYWLTAYGLLSFVYLMVVTFGISLFLMDQWLPLGLTVLFMTLYSRFALPAYHFTKHLGSQATQANRQRALISVTSIAIVTTVLIGLIPIPMSIKAKGVLQARDSNYLYVQAAGKLEKVWVHHGDRVHAGQRIASLKNPDLIQEMIMVERATQEASLQYRLALHRSPNELSAIQQQIETLTDRVTELKNQIDKLELVAQQDGEWVAPDLHELQGTWLQRGHTLGEVVDRRNFSFIAAIPQESADYLFKKRIDVCELRLTGQSDTIVQLNNPVIVPVQSNRLPSVALGWMGGGDLAVSTNDPVGDKTRESFYMLRVDLPHATEPEVTRLHGLTGTVHIRLDAQPIATQAYRGLQQLIQKRYAI